MSRTHILASTLCALSFAACGQEHTTAVRTQPAEPNATVRFTFDGNYEVSAISADPNCTYDDTTWNVQAAGDANSFDVDTALQVSYVHPTRALVTSSALTWTEQRDYSFQGCDYKVVSTYSASLDVHGNLEGTLTQTPVGTHDCVVAGRTCHFEIVSNRIQ